MSKGRLLIVDDEPDMLENCRRLLGRAGYDCLTTSDPRHFQPMNTNYGLFPPLPSRVRDKQERQRRIGQRALEDFAAWMQRSGLS